MRKKAKSILSLLMGATLALTLLPTSAIAVATPVVNYETPVDDNSIIKSDSSGESGKTDSETAVGSSLDDRQSTASASQEPIGEDEASYTMQGSAVGIAANTAYNETKFQAAVWGGRVDNAAGVVFAVWSDDRGQDDLRWYDAQHMPDASWAMEAPIANHRSTGKYTVHAYARMDNGLEVVAHTNFNVSTPKASAVRLFQLSAAQGTFTVYADDISGAPVTNVRVAVWAAANGQDDLHWYGTQKIGRSHTFGAYITNHKGQTGMYYADVYVTLSSGLDVFVGRSTANLTVSGGTVRQRNDGDRSVTVSCWDGIYGLASGVTYAVWSTAGGQDDLRWYRSYRQPDRSWPVAIPISNHRTAGQYIVHIYGEFPGGSTHIGTTSFNIAPNSATSVSTSLHDNNLGCFLVTVSGVKATTGVSQVLVPVWTKSNQADLRWYQAARQANGDYTVCIQATDHGLADFYSIHAYVTSGNGIQNYVGQATGAKLNLGNFTKVAGAAGSGSRAIWMKNPPTNVNYVYVWSAANGQDDLHCIPADYMGDRNWRANLNCHNLRHAGTCYADIYTGGKIGSGGSFYKRLTFNVADSDLASPAERDMNNRVSGLSSGTGWLIAVDTNNCFVQVYNGSQGNWHVVRNMPCAPGRGDSPSRKGIYSVGIKGYVFGHGYSCYYYTQYSGNYLFHSIKYNPGTFNVQDGTMGRPASNGCIRLWIENAKYIYDNVPSGSTVLVY